MWPTLRQRFTDLQWQIIGKYPVKRVVELAKTDGIEVLGEVPDIHPYARAAAAVVLPMRCGGGIKNKLLEAMAKPILASPRAVDGLELGRGSPRIVICHRPPDWVRTLRRL